MKFFSQAIFFGILGLIGAFIGLGQYYYQERIASNIIYQFNASSLSSLKIFILVDEQAYPDSTWHDDLLRFIEQSKSVDRTKKISVTAIKKTNSQHSQLLDSIAQAYPEYFNTITVHDFFKSRASTDTIPSIILENPDSDLAQQYAKILLLDDHSDSVYVTTSQTFPDVYKPSLSKNHFTTAINWCHILKSGCVFIHCYVPTKDKNQADIFVVDSDILVNMMQSKEVSILKKIAFERISTIEKILQQRHNVLSRGITEQQYLDSLKHSLSVYQAHPDLSVGLHHLEKWAVGSIFHDEMLTEYKITNFMRPLTAHIPASLDKYILQGNWSYALIKNYLQQEEISSLVTAVLIQQDYHALSKQAVNHHLLPYLAELSFSYEKNLSDDELFILGDINKYLHHSFFYDGSE